MIDAAGGDQAFADSDDEEGDEENAIKADEKESDDTPKVT